MTPSFAEGSDAYIYSDYTPDADDVVYSFKLITANDIPAGGSIEIEVPADVSLVNPSITQITPTTSANAFVIAFSGSTITLTVTNKITAGATAKFLITGFKNAANGDV